MRLSTRLQDRVIVVTGAASGQGLAEVGALAAEGAIVIASDVQPVVADATESIHPRRLDVAQPEEWRRLAE